MKRLAAALAACAVALAFAPVAEAALKPGARAPDFSAPAYLAGKPFTFKLSDALKTGPVVVYFFPSAYTKGCDIEAAKFSEAAAEFKALGATVIGVTAGKTDQLAKYSVDTKTCGGKFAVAADADVKIAKQYDAEFGGPIKLSNRTSYVIAPDGKVLHAYSAMGPVEHIDETLTAVKAWRSKAGK
jgi:peroxiredoxin Q/BCP